MLRLRAGDLREQGQHTRHRDRLRSLLDYYYFLRYDDDGKVELERLVEALLVHETYFFRELEPLQVLVEHFVEPLVKQGMRPRIWCAACATGEEPLTLAMLLASAGCCSTSS